MEWCFESSLSGTDVGCDCLKLDDVKIDFSTTFTAASSFVAAGVYNGVEISIGAAEGATGYLVVKFSPVSFRPVDGNSYSGSVSGATVVSSGSSTSVSDTGLTNGTSYYYTVWSYDSSNNYSLGVSDSAIVGVPVVQDFTAGTNNTALDLSWNIDGGTVASYLVVRAVGSSPSFNPVDSASYSTGAVSGGEIVYVGASS